MVLFFCRHDLKNEEGAEEKNEKKMKNSIDVFNFEFINSGA